MKCRIHTKGFRLWLWLPNRLAFSRPALSLALRIGQNYLRIPKERRPLLARDWKRLGKDWKGLPLVEIHTVQGDDIRITL